MSATRLGTGLVAGAACGLVAGWFVGDFGRSGPRIASPAPSADEARASTGTAEVPPPDLAAAAPLRVEHHDAGTEHDSRPSEREQAPEPPTTPADALISPELREHARAGIIRGWSSQRSEPIPDAVVAEGMKQFDDFVLRGPEQIGASLGTRTREEEAKRGDLDTLARTGDPILLLDRLDLEDAGPQVELVSDAARFARLFPASSGHALDGPAIADPNEAVQDGSHVVFPAGVFRLRGFTQHRDAAPRDVTVRGAGMKLTLLFVESLHARGELRNLAFEDCTLFAAPLLDIRARPGSLRLERVRAIGFDNGAGGSTLLQARGIAVLARACWFEGGYGRGNNRGALFDVRSDALLARFEGCRIDRIELRLHHLRPGASLAFVGCTLTDILDRRVVEQFPHRGLVFIGSRIEYSPDDDAAPLPPKDLNELFPGWEQRIQEAR